MKSAWTILGEQNETNRDAVGGVVRMDCLPDYNQGVAMKLLAFYVALLSLVLLLREYQQANEDREIRLLKQKHERLQKQSDSTKRVLAFLSTKPEFRKAASEVYIEILRAK